MPFAQRKSCAHCGLPVVSAGPARRGQYYCCYGCYLVSRLVGNQDGGSMRAWDLLRLGVGAFLSMDVMMISLLLYTGAVEPSAEPTFRWMMLGMAAVAMAILGYPFVLGAISEVRRRRCSLDTLIAVGSMAAFVVSAVNTIGGAGHVYFDTATMLLALVTFGKLIEAGAKGQAGKLLSSLETMLPESAARQEGDSVRDVPLEALAVGDVLRVRPGVRFAADGVIVEGTTTVQEAAFTGEANARVCRPGDEVFAGSVNGEGSLLVRATQVGGQMLLRRIVTMVEQARLRTSRTQRIAEAIAAVFVPVTLCIAVAAGLYWLLVAQAGWWFAARAALAVLVVACPCAMGISAPLATALAIARAARSGVIVRGGDIMERAGQVRTIFLDKTGTLTAGRPTLLLLEVGATAASCAAVQVSNDGAMPVSRLPACCQNMAGNSARHGTDFIPQLRCDTALDNDELLCILAGLELASEHSLAGAVVAAATDRGLSPVAARDVHVTPGAGISGIVELPTGPQRVHAGSAEFVGQCCPFVPPSSKAERSLGVSADHSSVASVVYVAWDGLVRGRATFSDRARPDAAKAMQQLKELNIEPVLLSGDNAAAASATAGQLGISAVFASSKPDEKIARIRAAREGGEIVAMVGDGVNDAPALAAADVGIALGGGTDLAAQAGNVVLVSDRLAQIPWLVRLGRQTRRIIKQNLFWAIGYNTVAIGAAACGVLHPLLAAVAMAVSSLTVLSNSLRISRFEETTFTTEAQRTQRTE